jgi:tetratricopeptide (TPR) repeat protein
MHVRSLAIVALLAVAGGALSQPGVDLDRAQALIRAGRAEDAWRLLAPHESQRAGDPEYDFVLGVAALESGRENLATFVLERVIAVNPGHAAARLEMGRAYFALRDFERAERQFDALEKSGPPPHVHEVIDSYRRRMTPASIARVLPRRSGYLALAAGRSTNVNTASAHGSVFVPALGSEFVPDPLFVRRGDDFSLLAGGMEFTRPIAPTDEFFAGLDASQRLHAEVQAFDALSAEIHMGVQRRLAPSDSVRLLVGHNEFRLDESGYRRVQFAAAEWNRTYQQRARAALFLQSTRIRYLQEAYEASSSDLLVLGSGGAYVLHEASRSVLSGRLYAGFDEATRGRLDGDRRLRGLSVALQRVLLTGFEGYASVGASSSEFRRRNSAFGVLRKDRHIEGAVGVSVKLAEGWYMTSQLSRDYIVSNVPLNEYSRTEVTLGARRVWQ